MSFVMRLLFSIVLSLVVLLVALPCMNEPHWTRVILVVLLVNSVLILLLTLLDKLDEK